MTVKLAPIFNGWQGFTPAGLPLNLGYFYTYAAGGTTPTATFTTSAGSVQNANPIPLGVDGRPPNEVWLTAGTAYRFDLYDSLGNLIKTYDNLSGINDTASSDVTFLQAGTAAVTRTVQDRLRDSLNVFDWFTTAQIADVKARTAAVDVATALQAAIDAAKTANKALFFPAGVYLVNSPLDGTFANDGSANFWMIGEGKFESQILGTFTGADATHVFPVLDFTGNTYGGIAHMGVKSTSASSKATAALLVAKPTSGGGNGNVVTINDVYLALPTSGAASAVMGLVVFNSDLTRVIDSQIQGPGGASMGFGKSASVASKFRTLSASTDSTMLYVQRSSFNGAAAPALEYTGGAAISIDDTYCALVGVGGASGIIKVSSTSGASGNAVYAKNLRTENQSSATGVPAIYFDKGSTGGGISGNLESDTTGAVFSFNTALTLADYNINVVSSTCNKLFAGSPTVAKCDILANNNGGDVGAMNAASYGINWMGNITAASILAACGAAYGHDIIYAGQRSRSMLELLIPPKRVSSSLRPVGNFSQAGISTTAYTGGSGEQLVYSYTFPGAILNNWDGGISNPAAQLLIVGTLAATAGAGGRIRVNLLQGGGNVDILDTGANVVAGAGTFDMLLLFYNVGTTNSRAYAKLDVEGSAANYLKKAFTNTQATIVLNADFTVRVYVTNTGNSPYGLELQTGTLL